MSGLGALAVAVSTESLKVVIEALEREVATDPDRV